MHTTTTHSLEPAVRDLTILVIEWDLVETNSAVICKYTIKITKDAHTWTVCYVWRAATVARFIYRDTESVGEGDKLDTAAVQI